MLNVMHSGWLEAFLVAAVRELPLARICARICATSSFLGFIHLIVDSRTLRVMPRFTPKDPSQMHYSIYA